ncbi:glycoside hydrolase family 2 protein [Acidicapsa ligni]|uniref:glycoside hydrolase family 2 protein n=1 Tax=Acidicapsa ligni TaxID=542300 RepID=UPI0021E07843|nr:glycoside hydrolase family 2 TIM barrel-domain containing protein [Acidicapsa ligni]
MDRRDFLKTGSLCLAGTALPHVAIADTSHSSRFASSGRVILPINHDWLFTNSVPPHGELEGYSESGMEHVTLPHSNVKFSWHNFDEKSFQTVSLYRHHFRLPESARESRVFLDFEGAMASSRVWLNGVAIGEYQGGYTPFSFEITQAVRRDADNVIALELDSRETPEIPPFGYEIDYLTFGGIYREVSLRIVGTTYIDNIFARPADVLSSHPYLDVDVFLDSAAQQSHKLAVEITLLEGERTIRTLVQDLQTERGKSKHTVKLDNLTGIHLWTLEQPQLYEVRVRLLQGSALIDQDSQRVGFRTATFTDHGFELNGKPLKLRGLNRHQAFPYVGNAMPRRVQRRDAQILKHELKCNIVRTSHYPPSRHFMDACDELGLLVLEEIPGWQHVGENAWQDLAVDNVRRMIERDWNRPSVILWSIRINESRDFHDFYVRTNALARSLDPTRQTCGVRYFQESEFLEDVFCMNDFSFPLKAPNHSRYLNTEFVGAEWSVRSWDNNDVHKEHIVRYAKIYDQLQTDARYSGGLGWCAFDYPTHRDFGSGDHICYHGVMDIFRVPKPAAGFYKSQCSPAEEVVLEAGFHWAMNDGAAGFPASPINSNCDTIKCSIGQDGKWHEIIQLQPDRKQFPHLAYPPFFLTLPNGNDDWGDLRLDGYIQGELKISRSYSGKGIDQDFHVQADDLELVADGSDATRVVLRATDEYGNVRTLSNAPVTLEIEGPAHLIGPSLLSLVGGVAAVWIQVNDKPGNVKLTARHAELGTRSIELTVQPARI